MARAWTQDDYSKYASFFKIPEEEDEMKERSFINSLRLSQMGAPHISSLDQLAPDRYWFKVKMVLKETETRLNNFAKDASVKYWREQGKVLFALHAWRNPGF